MYVLLLLISSCHRNNRAYHVYNKDDNPIYPSRFIDSAYDSALWSDKGFVLYRRATRVCLDKARFYDGFNIVIDAEVVGSFIART